MDGSGLVPDSNRGCDNRIAAVPFSWPHVAPATWAMRLICLRPARISPIGVISGGTGWSERNARGIVMLGHPDRRPADFRVFCETAAGVGTTAISALRALLTASGVVNTQDTSSSKVTTTGDSGATDAKRFGLPFR